MKVTFVSNYINHHQIPVSDCLYRELGDDYKFIQTQPMEEERIKMGWDSHTDMLPYVLHYEEQEEVCKQLILTSDIVIFGGVEDESYIEPRLKEGKIVLRYSERLYKEGQWKAISPRGLMKKYHDHTRYRKAPVYMLCSGGYVADDFSIIHAYPGKMFRWGYFPAFEESSEEIRKEWKKRSKTGNTPIDLLWAGRIIDWKHTLDAIEATAQLKEQGILCHLNIIGDGNLKNELQEYVSSHQLEESITFLGAKTPAQVREAMKSAEIFLFTSDYKEGWGAVLNEAMNCGCAVVASHAIGAVPYLLRDMENGIIYKSGNVSKLACAVKMLVQDDELRHRLGENAYGTIASQWNPQSAASRLMNLCTHLLQGEIVFAESGPLSRAPRIRQRKMYRYLKGSKNE